MNKTHGVFGEYVQALHLDKKIFEQLIENHPQLSETNLGNISQIQIPEMTDKEYRDLIIDLRNISNYEANKLNKENPWLKWVP